MRVRLPLGRTLFLLCVFLAAFVALLPMRLALDWLGLDDRGLSARETGGSIWLGSLVETRIGGAAFGDLSAALSPLHLLAGRARIQFARRGDGEPFEGALTVSRHSFGLDDVTAHFSVASIFAPFPVAGLDLADLSVRFVDGQCDRAEGQVTATTAGFADLALPPTLSGGARCEGGALLLPLASSAGGEMLALTLHADGRYEAELGIRPADPTVVARLLTAGFAPGTNGYSLTIAGRF